MKLLDQFQNIFNGRSLVFIITLNKLVKNTLQIDPENDLFRLRRVHDVQGVVQFSHRVIKRRGEA